jgi:molybdopterin-guanine dinucleotide biosynthesis protein A
MGGADKGLVHHAGRPLIAQVCERLAPQVAEMAISANRNQDHYREFAATVLGDVFRDPGEAYPGPLAGVHAGLLAARHAWLLYVPCDAPLLPLDLGERLASALIGVEAPGALARSGGRLQPTFGLLHRDLAPRVEAALRAGERALGRTLRSLGVLEVEFPDDAAFSNVNALDETA